MLTGCIFWQVDYAASCNANLKRYSSFDVHMYVCILLYKLYVPYIFFLYFEDTWFVSFNISYYSFSFKRLLLTFVFMYRALQLYIIDYLLSLFL